MKLLREPLFHFVMLGVAIFVIYVIASDIFAARTAHRIEITAAQVEMIAEGFSRRWQRPPTEEELRNLVDARVREEVLYREALAVGLDENDVVVRRRMVQKMEMLSEDLALLADPTEQELQAYYQERQEEYRIPPRLSFSQVYFNLDRRGPAGEEEARRLLAELRATTPTPTRAPDSGDRFMLGHDFSRLSPEEVQREFGQMFAADLFDLEPGWHGPIASGFGLHLVYVRERSESRIPDFTEIRERLLVDYNVMRRDKAKEALYEGLSTRYEIEIAEGALRSTSPD
jgi:hypothetical protein